MYQERQATGIVVEMRSEEGTSSDPASVRVYRNEELITEVTAHAGLRRGGDGGMYPCVAFRVTTNLPDGAQVEIHEESWRKNSPARAVFRLDGKIIFETIGEIEEKPGADGGLYRCVTLYCPTRRSA